MLDSDAQTKIRKDSALGRPANYNTEEELTYRQQVDNEDFPEGIIEDVPGELPDL